MATVFWTKRQRPYLVFIFCIGFAIAPIAANAQILGGPLIDGSFQNMRDISDGWARLYEQTFFSMNGNSVWLSVRFVGKLILAFASLYFLYRICKTLMAGTDWRVIIAPIFVFLFCLYLIGGPQSPSVSLAYGAIKIKDSIRDGLMEMRLTDVRLADAIKDSLLTQDAKSRLLQEGQYCDQIVARPVLLPSRTRPKDPKIKLTADQKTLYTKMECYQRVAEYAQKLQQAYEQQACMGVPAPVQRCVGLRRFMSSFIDSLGRGMQNEWVKITDGRREDFNPLGPALSVGDMLLGTYSIQPVKFWMQVLQGIYINAISAVYYLSVLTLPPAIAMAIIPFGPTNTLKVWLGAFFGTCLAEIYYVLLIGLSATIISNTTTSYFSDIVAALVFGLGAPIGSYYLSKLSAAGMIAGISSQASAVITAVPVLGGIIAGFSKLR